MTAERHYPRSGIRPTAAPPPPGPAEVLADLSAGCRLSPRLSPCEEQLMGLVARGLTVGEIAALLWKSAETVESQKKSALHKLGARNAAHGTALWLLRRVRESTSERMAA